MFKGLLLVSLVSTSLLFGADRHYTCKGKTDSSQNVKVTYHQSKDENDRAIADVTVSIQGESPETYHKLYVFTDDEGGFDYGVSTTGFQLLLVLPPNWLPGNQVGGILMTRKFREVRLSCK